MRKGAWRTNESSYERVGVDIQEHQPSPNRFTDEQPLELSMSKFRHQGRNRFRALVGQPGVIYVLENDGLRHGWFKIGCSTRSGQARAFDLNTDANTGTPGAFRCIYQHRTLDCGTAEQEVFAILGKHRRGKWGQEFFEVDLALAKSTIELVCGEVDRRQPSPAPPTPSSSPDVLSGGFAERPSASGRPITPVWSRAGGSTPIRRRWLLGACIVAVLAWLNFGPSVKTPPRIYATPAPNLSPPSPKSAKPIARERSNEPVQPKSGGDSNPDVPRAPTAEVPARNKPEQLLPSKPTGATTSSEVGLNSTANQVSGTPVGPLPIASEPTMTAKDANLSDPNRFERSYIHSGCSSESLMQDPVAYNRCLTR